MHLEGKSVAVESQLLHRFVGLPVAVIGDVMLDTYVIGDVERLSSEAPVAILHERSTEHRLGGAANAAANLAALGCPTTLVGISRTDRAGRALRQLLRRSRIRSRLFREPSRPTTEKIRAVASGQQLLRIDTETSTPIRRATEAALLRAFDEILPVARAILISDYGKGTLTSTSLAAITRAGRRRRIPIVVDGKVPDVRRYRGATVFAPSHRDAIAMTGIEATDDRRARRVAAILARHTRSAILLTLGPAGMLLRLGSGRTQFFRSHARAVFDATGAGDTVAAVLTASLAAGTSLPHAVELASRAAAIVVAKFGTSVVTRNELLETLV